jgi:hypothetical protein
MFMIKRAIIASVVVCAAVATFADNVESTNSMPMAQGSPAFALTPGRLGAGIVVGEPTGVSAKYWLNHDIAIDGSFGIRLRDADDVYLNGDLLWHNYNLIPVSTGRMAAYIGAGPSVLFRHEEDNRFGVRVPVGLAYKFENKPVDVFAEFAPILDLSPDVRGDFNVGIGVRYWF